ncbi:MAG: beta strand repeat-containing protein [Gemmataceae bacterium]
MKRTYPALRIERLEDRTNPTATASPFNVAAGGATWFLANNVGAFAIAPGQTGFGIGDAALAGPPLRTDAYDGAFLMAVNGTVYQDPDGTVDLSGTTVTTDPVNLSGLDSWIEYYFDSTSATVRAIYNFSNSTAADIVTNVQIGTNLGSDAGLGSVITATSSGDTILDPTDRWFVSSDTLAHDPTLTFVRYGPGAAVTPVTLLSPLALQDNYEEQFSITVPAGQTRRIMMFGQLHQDDATAATDATTFDSDVTLANSGLLTGLSGQQLSEIVNWDFAALAPQATLNAPDVTDVGPGNNIDATTVSKYTFTVTYTDPTTNGNIDVTSLDNADIQVTGPNGFNTFATFESSNPAVNSNSVTATYSFTPPGGKWDTTDNGTYTFTLINNQVFTENGNAAQTDQVLGTMTVDMNVPGVTIDQSAGQTDPTNQSPVDFTVTFTEPVFGFTSSDVDLTGSTAFSNINNAVVTVVGNPGDSVFTVHVSGMDQSGIITANIPAGAATDVSDEGNNPSTSTDNTVTFSTGPQATLAANNVNDANVNAGNVSTYTFTVTFNDPDNIDVSTLNGDEIRVTGPNGFDSLASLSSFLPPINSPSVTATYTFTPPGGTWNAADNGNYTFTFEPGSLDNGLGFGNTQQNLGTINVTMNAPTVTINQAAAQPDPTTVSTINFTVVFSEPVTGFDGSDVTLSGTAHPTTAVVTGSGTTYNVAVTGMNSAGTVIATVKPGAAQDISGDTNAASTSTDNTVTFVVTTPPHVELYATGADAGGGPHVRVFNADGSDRFSFYAYASTFTGGVRVVTGDVTGDGVDDIITGAGAGGGPHVRVFNGATGALQAEWFAYAANFTGGVYVGVADINNDGLMEVITGAGEGGGPHVRVFNGSTGAVVREFFAYDARFLGGVRVAGGDVNNDGFDDIITGAGPGGGPHVIAYSGKDNSILQSFYAFDPDFNGGVYVAAGDINSDNQADIIVGAGRGDARVKVFSGAGSNGDTLLSSFLAYGSGVRSGVHVGVTDINNDGVADIMTGPARDNPPDVRIFNSSSGAVVREFFPYDISFVGGVFVG